MDIEPTRSPLKPGPSEVRFQADGGVRTVGSMIVIFGEPCLPFASEEFVNEWESITTA